MIAAHTPRRQRRSVAGGPGASARTGGGGFCCAAALRPARGGGVDPSARAKEALSPCHRRRRRRCQPVRLATTMGSTQREEAFPPPPPYQPTVGEREQYAPPPCPPPSQGAGAYNPPPNPPPEIAGPPSLSAAPPIYEPFSFSTAFARAHNANAPGWHAPPAYHIYHDPNSASITFHIALPSTEPPCACANDFYCQCGRRRPALWHASSMSPRSSRKTGYELQRLSPFSQSRQLAFQASSDSLLSSSSSLSIRDGNGKTQTQMKKKAESWSFKDLDGNLVTWTRHGQRLELSNSQDMPLAVLHMGSPARLELTAFAWGRMPSDEIECDFPACALQPLFGFVFRCRDCTEQGDDSFDICEAHLFTECRDHDQSHHFIRQPRPFAEFDDYVQETPLLKAEDLKQERKQHELVVMTLACILLHAKS